MMINDVKNPSDEFDTLNTNYTNNDDSKKYFENNYSNDNNNNNEQKYKEQECAEQDNTQLIKTALFDYIDNSKTLPKFIVAQDFDGATQDILSACYKSATNIGTINNMSHSTVCGVLATGILHYLLTKALVKSQRKVSHRNVELDIVIPDTKTLDADPLQTLVICIAMTDNLNTICDKLLAISKIHPVCENIWLISSNPYNVTKYYKSIRGMHIFKVVKKFVIANNQSGNFTEILSSIGSFTRYSDNKDGNKGSDKLRILGI